MKAGERFYPDFHRIFLNDNKHNRMSIFEMDPSNLYDPSDPLDSGIRYGLNHWLRNITYKSDPELYNDIFSFAQLSRAEHRSPLFVELAVIISIGFIPAILTYGVMMAVANCKRKFAEVGIREKELEIKDEESKQKKIQTEILEELRKTIKEKGIDSVPDNVLAATAATSSAPVNDLGSSPLVGSITFGVSRTLK